MYGHALVAGIERYPRKVTKTMSKKKLTKRTKINLCQHDTLLMLPSTKVLLIRNPSRIPLERERSRLPSNLLWKNDTRAARTNGFSRNSDSKQLFCKILSL